jgi:hypothetical protein
MNNESKLFFFATGAAEYIKNRASSIVISFDLEPALGGCACSNAQLTGTLIPAISLGAPIERDRFVVDTVRGINIYYPEGIGLKPDASCITIKLRNLLFAKWLEVDGAQSKSVFH